MENEIYSPELLWYVVSTTTGYENKVKISLENKVKNLGLQDQITEVYIPIRTYEVSDRKGNVKIKEEKLTPNYVFVHMICNEKTRQCVFQTENVINFVGPENHPTPLSTAEIERLGITNVPSSNKFNVGDHVQILDGFMKGWSGVIKAISEDGNTATVLANAFNRETPVDVSIKSIEKI